MEILVIVWKMHKSIYSISQHFVADKRRHETTRDGVRSGASSTLGAELAPSSGARSGASSEAPATVGARSGAPS